MADAQQVYDIVVELIEAGVKRPPSRNRHYEEWSDPVQGAAYRIFSRLQRISGEVNSVLGRGREVKVSMPEGEERHLHYVLEKPQGNVRRTARVAFREWELLLLLCPGLAHPSSAGSTPA